MSALDAKLSAALASRDVRHIRRRLPDPTSASSPTCTDFTANDYLSLASSPLLRARVLAALQSAPDILGSGGSRLLVNGIAHAALEERLRVFFDADAALLFNSGFDANAGFFASVPQPGDALVMDAHIHASVHDGARASRVDRAHRHTFAHNDVHSLRTVLTRLQRDLDLDGGQGAGRSIFIAVESVYSMDGTIAPLVEIADTLSELFPAGNAHLVVDEAHATGLYGPAGRGLVAALGLEKRVFARLHTFGKALAAGGAVLLISPLVKDYLVNFARPLIYTTSMSNAGIVAAGCSFDLLEDGTADELAVTLHDTTAYFLARLRVELMNIPRHTVRLPAHLSLPSPSFSLPTAPIVPLLTPQPRPLASFLRERGMNARPISWPTVPKGEDRVRVCLSAGLRWEDVDQLVDGIRDWAKMITAEEVKAKRKESAKVKGAAVGVLMESKL